MAPTLLLKTDFLLALQTILEIQRPTGNVPYAQTYANAILNRTCPWTKEYISPQILYIQGNLSSWRGAESKQVKAVLKSTYEDLSKLEDGV